eukprot:g1434.t1
MGNSVTDFIEGKEGWIVAGFAANLAILLALYNIYRHLSNYHTPHLQIWTVRIIIIVPVYAFVSWMSLKFQEEALYFNTVRDIYEAYIIYCFIALMLAYGGGENNCLVLMRSRGHLAHPCPLNLCFSPMPLDAKFMRRCKQGCIQFVVLKPILAIMSLIFMAVGKYDSTGYQAFLLTVYNISYTLALYYLFLFYLATREFLKEQHIVLKFFAVKTVVFLTYWQMLAVESWPGLTTETGEACNDFILCIEMVFFAFLHLKAFSCEDAKDSGNRSTTESSSVMENVRQVVSINDVIDDAYHNFMPEYQDYVQASNGAMVSPAMGGGHVQEKSRKFKSKIFVKGGAETPSSKAVSGVNGGDESGVTVNVTALASAVPVNDDSSTGESNRALFGTKKKATAQTRKKKTHFETEMTELHSRLREFENDTLVASSDSNTSRRSEDSTSSPTSVLISPPPKSRR